MEMQIRGNHDYSGTDYTERVKERQAILKAERAAEAEKAAEEKTPAGCQNRDEYISSEKSEKKPTGLYRVGQDPKAVHANAKAQRSREGEDGKEPKASGDSQGKPAEKCVANTDRVEREIRKLKEKKQQLEQQIQSVSGDEKKIRELEKKLAQVENELSRKDNDTYRRQNASVSE